MENKNLEEKEGGGEEENKSWFSNLFWKSSEPSVKECLVESEIEREVADLVDASEGWDSFGWEFVCEENGVTVTRTTVPNSSIKCSRGIAVMRATPLEVFELVRNISVYKEWEPKIIESKLVQTYDDATTTNYLEFAPWFTLSARDVCFLQHAKKLRDGSYVVCWRSVEEPLVPRRRGIVRAKMSTSGFVITPLQRQSLVTFVLQFDLKGWIPSNIINQITASQPMILSHIQNQIEPKSVLRTQNVHDDQET
eukprot:TRINITY_DN2171_c0_g1_i1.p1 TRINITY_DN2171_c0_g1~~TRINITY_DN2171_c0_g1_i1.p1  ORF type:complete len:252 (+),score=58.45 TRINITY_DN2171_c0_g1_i1:193-948(+)